MIQLLLMGITIANISALQSEKGCCDTGEPSNIVNTPISLPPSKGKKKTQKLLASSQNGSNGRSSVVDNMRG
jgi:hypothetical protein